jgi:hypothetical protein
VNEIGLMKSQDLKSWHKTDELITLDQNNWEWAKGRLTAGFILDCKDINIGKYIMFFHGIGPQDESVTFDTNACIGIAWSDDLVIWVYPKN